MEDFTIKVVDMETKNIIRVFSNNSQITDMTFSFDAKWLLVSSLNCTIKTWDLILSQLIDCFLVATPCISLDMSPTGEFLATCHLDNLGIYLWSNITLYCPVSLRPLTSDHKPSVIDLPCVRADSSDDIDDEEEITDESGFLNDQEMDADVEYKSPEQIASELITLSELPASRWKNLLNIDEIKVG